MNTYNGMLRASVLQVRPIGILSETYHKPMAQWLTNFALDDGYKPFNPNFAVEMTQYLKSQGVTGLPDTRQGQIDLFGVGWWKYDPEKATQLLTKHGFRLINGRWYKPDGSLWQIDLFSPKDFSVQSVRIAFAVAEQWKKFGIDVNVREMEAAPFWDANNTGNFAVGSYWPACGSMPDVTSNISIWHKQYYAPIGSFANNTSRWQNDDATTLIDKLISLSPDDPQLVPTTTELLKVFVAEMPFLPIFGSTVFIPTDDYYWTNFPNAENNYTGPWWWWSQFKYIVPYITPAQ
jgi:peptide/nickel transport system substrate-binding protein